MLSVLRTSVRSPTTYSLTVRCFSSAAPQGGAAPAAKKSDPAKTVVLVDGGRIPFALSGTIYNDMMSYDLARLAIKGIMNKTVLDPKHVDCIIWGTVVQDVTTSNIAREAALGAGLPNSIPAFTVTQACISANAAISSAAEKIMAGTAEVVLAGGSETFSDVPIRYSRALRKRMLAANKAMKKGPMGILKLLKGIKLGDLAPVPPAIKNFSTGEIMGHSSDRLASRFGVSRDDQDKFALASHKNAAAAHENGMYDDEIIPVDGNTTENGIRGDTTMEKLAKLKAAFVKPHGTHTAANSSFLTDGAAATLIMSEKKALELGYTPKAYIRNWTFQAVDPFEEMLLGPTYATAKVLKDSGLKVEDIDVWEIHEAFAGQVLSNVNAMGDDKFGKEVLGLPGKLGDIPMDKVNKWGGSLSLGHPFGATGARIVTTGANRLKHENGRYALLTACADSGIGHACLLEKYGA